MSTILVKRGPQDGITNLVLQPGEFALAKDTVYTLPAATDSVRGGVKVGNGLNISGDVLSVGDIDGGTF